MSGPTWPGTLVPFPLSANTVSEKLGRLTTPPQRPIGYSQESHLPASRARVTPEEAVSEATGPHSGFPTGPRRKHRTLSSPQTPRRERGSSHHRRAGGVGRGRQTSSGRAFLRRAPLVPGSAPPRLLFPTSGPRSTARTAVSFQGQMGDPQMVGEVRWPRRRRRPHAPHL